MRRYQLLSIFINIGVLLILSLGLVVIFGWYTGSQMLIQINPQFAPMQFNTAVGFILISIAIIGLTNNHRKFVKYLGIVLIALGSLTLAQHIFGANFYIDELLMKHYIMTATSQPGRMAPNTALNFLLSGITIFIISKPKVSVKQLLICSLLGAVTMGLGVVAVLGYLSHVETAYGWGKLTKMAIHTAIGFVVVGFILILETKHLSWQTKQKISFLAFPTTLGVVGFTTTICLWQALYSSQLYIANQYGIKSTNFVAEGILVFGSLFSIVTAIATWLAIKSNEQLQTLKLAQKEILELNKQLEKISFLDGLTQIANRRALDIAIEKELSRAYRYQQPIALILFDIDYFKAYNDHYGHQRGDHCLQEVAFTINNMARRKPDLAARYGGEEFALLLPDVTQTDAEKIAAMTLQAIANLQIPHEASKISAFVTTSAGINVCIPSQGTTAIELINKADKALYEAKAQGRGIAVVYKNK